MKEFIFMAVAALFVSCSDHQLMDSNVDVKDAYQVEKTDDKAKVDALIERARWGDGRAYLQLADCYRDGIGVPQDFFGMIYMLSQARDCGAIESGEDYIRHFPEDNDFTHLYLLIGHGRHEIMERKDSIMAQIRTVDCPDALAVSGVVSVECGDTTGGFRTIRMAADSGSAFATLLVATRNGEWKKNTDRSKLEQIADKIPFAYKLLGEACLKPDEDGNIDERQAAAYYLKAERHALLERQDIRWLLDYYKRGGDVPLSNEDISRLEAMAGIPFDEELVAPDTVGVDSVVVEN